ncbi:hypothetical protein JHN61_05565 [Streptomyces sp. MBT67]|uniref:hypothetical protein n=1 Tax=unclassified Streptomyces TaxID=2593676 RepID=UPI00190ADD25|nr:MULTISPECIES: hypothetical protein [unclassified Streptomyces]MBK3529847.1 hypothetical protein [Streptomyces sp. MBT72]MBK3535681.1 hypothetical protein [Streptomyces sp. MBT67]MBK3550994.1 hypothetical protein [Streptomyces sp. MBT61]MBK6027721.1 hypothetical protein [Streptomyces sp. MBT59]
MSDADRIRELEEQVRRLEEDKDMWEKKYEEASERHRRSEAKLADLETSMQDL